VLYALLAGDVLAAAAPHVVRGTGRVHYGTQ